MLFQNSKPEQWRQLQGNLGKPWLKVLNEPVSRSPSPRKRSDDPQTPRVNSIELLFNNSQKYINKLTFKGS
jgi:hypothetical protein